jgi:hypothetical protein
MEDTTITWKHKRASAMSSRRRSSSFIPNNSDDDSSAAKPLDATGGIGSAASWMLFFVSMDRLVYI